MTTDDIREVLDEEAATAIQAYVNSMGEKYAVEAVECRCALRRAVSRHAKEHA